MTEKTTISKKEALRALWRLLVELFDDKEKALHIAQGAGINAEQISTGGTAGDYWWRILVEAHNRGKVQEIAKNASWEMVERASTLKKVYRTYADAPDAGEPLDEPIFEQWGVCGACGGRIVRKARFCPRCGSVLSSAPPLPAAPLPPVFAPLPAAPSPIIDAVRRVSRAATRFLPLSDNEKIPLDLSISHARRIAKGHSSPFLVDLYLPELEQHVKTRQVEAFQKEPVEEHRYPTKLTQGLPVIIELASPSIEFTPPKKTNLSNQHNSIQFVGMPAVTTVPGSQAVLITIRDADNETEYFSRTFGVEVVDFAFDHVSRPKLEAAISVVSGVGAVAMWALALLGQIDQTLGLAAGTAAAGASAFFVARIQWLYRAAAATQQFHQP